MLDILMYFLSLKIHPIENIHTYNFFLIKSTLNHNIRKDTFKVKIMLE